MAADKPSTDADIVLSERSDELPSMEELRANMAASPDLPDQESKPEPEIEREPELDLPPPLPPKEGDDQSHRRI